MNSLLDSLGYNTSYAYIRFYQAACQINMAKFQAKNTSFMILTDVAPHGIDIRKFIMNVMLENVINN